MNKRKKEELAAIYGAIADAYEDGTIGWGTGDAVHVRKNYLTGELSEEEFCVGGALCEFGDGGATQMYNWALPEVREVLSPLGRYLDPKARDESVVYSIYRFNDSGLTRNQRQLQDVEKPAHVIEALREAAYGLVYDGPGEV